MWTGTYIILKSSFFVCICLHVAHTISDITKLWYNKVKVGVCCLWVLSVLQLCVTHGKQSSSVWFTYFLSVQMNDDPLCKCSAKARRTGIRHSIYPGEEVWHVLNKSPFHNLEVLPQRGKDIILVTLNICSAHSLFFYCVKGSIKVQFEHPKTPNDDIKPVRVWQGSRSMPVTHRLFCHLLRFFGFHDSFSGPPVVWSKHSQLAASSTDQFTTKSMKNSNSQSYIVVFCTSFLY